MPPNVRATLAGPWEPCERGVSLQSSCPAPSLLLLLQLQQQLLAMPPIADDTAIDSASAMPPNVKATPAALAIAIIMASMVILAAAVARASA